jgi:hypothetical protein
MSEIQLRLHACSVSRSLRDGLLQMQADGRVLSVFRRACVISYGHDAVLALVAPELGNGPHHAVMERAYSEWLDLQPGTLARLHGKRIQLGRLEVSLDDAEIWEPCLAWEHLRANAGTLVGRLESLLDQLDDRISGDSLLGLFRDPWRSESLRASVVHARALSAAEALWAGWRGDEAQLNAGAAGLAGLGGGLTPAGDDFALGAMLCAWLVHPTPARYCETVLAACLPRTTVLSRAFLRSAAMGEFSAPWHRLLEELDGGSGEQLNLAAREVLSYGHTSGADALAGFLWLGLRQLDS